MANIRPLQAASGRLKQLQDTDSLQLNFPGFFRNDGRLTLSSGDSVPAADQLAKTTLYWIAGTQGAVTTLYTGTIWRTVAMGSGASVAVPSTTNTMYDVFAYLDTGDTLALEVIAWTNDTTRATAIAGQDGMAVKSGDPTRLYIGTFRTTGTSGQTEDSEKKRFIYNRFNRWPRSIRVTESTTSWTYTTPTVRQANANSANQFEMVVGFTDVFIDITAYGKSQNTGQAVERRIGLGFDSTTTNSGTQYQNVRGNNPEQPLQMQESRFCGQRTDQNYQKFMWLEYSAATLTTTWYGGVNSGLQGWVLI
jgi:hypothetical protein